MASEIKVDTIVNAGGDNDSGIDLGTNDEVKIKTANTNHVVIDSAGNMGLGTTSVNNIGAANRVLEINGGSLSPWIHFTNDTSGVGANDGHIIGTEGSDTYYINRENGTQRFHTNNTERMRIDSSGNLMVAKTSVASSSVGFEARANGFNACTRDGDQPLEVRRLSSDGVLIDLRKDGSTVGSISTNANSLPSDKNFKRDIKDLNIGLDLVSQLQPKSFNLIVDDENSPVMYGLVAQDLEIALEKVGVTKNSAWILQHEEKNDAKESDYSLDYGKLIPILINAIKELQAKVTALESK
jgi:hypothetical protein